MTRSHNLLKTRSLTMLLSRTAIFLACCFTFNPAMANNTTTVSPIGYTTNTSESYSEQLRPRKRGQSQQTVLPSAWAIDTSQGGTLCYIDPEQVVLWREDISSTSRLSIKARGSNKPLMLRWAKNQDTFKWPHKRVKLTSDHIYYVKLNQHERPSIIITSKQLPEQLWDADKAEQIAWMQANDCLPQANYLQQTH